MGNREPISTGGPLLRPLHTSKLDTVNNLGLLYANQGQLAEAEQMYQQALQGFEKALRAEHTLTLQTVNNLGALCTVQGKLDNAGLRMAGSD